MESSPETESGELSTNIWWIENFCLSPKVRSHFTNIKIDLLQIYLVVYNKYDELVLIKKQEAAANEENIYGLLLP